jgi:parallel beta-helix repeat protein
MSCGCSNNTSTACPEVPYPTISPESVPSLINNLVYALYGTIEKSVSSGRVIWNIPCDPNNTAEVPTIPRNEGEGLLCYIIRCFDAFVNGEITFNENTNYQVTGTPTARNLATRGADIINVKDFGATGNGTTDDTAAIQAAITAAPAGAAIYFPRGSYKAYAVQITKDIRIFGDGMDVTELVFGQEYGAATNVGTYFKQTSYFNLNGGVEFYIRNLTMVDKFGFRATGKFLSQTGFPIQPMGIAGNNRDSQIASDFANLIDVQNVKFLDLYIPIETNAKKLVCVNNQFLWTYGKASVGMPIYQVGNGPLPTGGTGKYFGDPHAAILGGFGTCLIKDNYYNGLIDYTFANANKPTGWEDYRIAAENFLDLRCEKWIIDAWQTNEDAQQEVINNTVVNHGIEGFIWAANPWTGSPVIPPKLSLNVSNNFFRPVQFYWNEYYYGTTPCLAFRTGTGSAKIVGNRFENTFQAIAVVPNSPDTAQPYATGNVEISNNVISGCLEGIYVTGLKETDIISNNTIFCQSKPFYLILAYLRSIGSGYGRCPSNLKGINVWNCNPFVTNNTCSAEYQFDLTTTLVSQASNVLILANATGIVTTDGGWGILIKYQNRARFLPVTNVSGNNVTVDSAFLGGTTFPNGITVYWSRFFLPDTGAINIVNQRSQAPNLNQAFYNTTIKGFLKDNSSTDVNGTGNSSTMVNTTAIDVYEKFSSSYPQPQFFKEDGFYYKF